jgi:hypothetical protein
VYERAGLLQLPLPEGAHAVNRRRSARWLKPPGAILAHERRHEAFSQAVE